MLEFYTYMYVYKKFQEAYKCIHESVHDTYMYVHVDVEYEPGA